MHAPSTPEQRAELERFIAARFQRAYGARITQFLPNLLGMRDDAGAWVAAVGYAGAGAGPLFLEQYLDNPVEHALGLLLEHPVARERVVEVGNFAAVRAGVARRLIPALAARLKSLGFELAVFTATRELRNAFLRLRLWPLLIAPADPLRLAGGAAAWGGYYAHKPIVMGGRIADCLLRLR
jgi:hypothetical protein